MELITQMISKANKEKAAGDGSCPIAAYGLGGCDLQLWALHVEKNWNGDSPNCCGANSSLRLGFQHLG